MKENLTINEIVYDTNILGPRPHYLESARVRQEEGCIYLEGIVHFDQTDPTISDRVLGSFPHVNVTHAYFGVWNAVRAALHVTRGSYANFSLAKTSARLREQALPDERVQLELRIEEKRRLADTKVYGSFTATYKRADTILMELSGSGIMFE